MSLNEEQNLAVQRALEGHNILIHGPAGTGKSYVIKQIIDTIKKTPKKLSVTATTGIACVAYPDAMTIHKWSGYGDGRNNKKEIAELVQHNRHYMECKQRIIETDILIIDECSMMSRKLFECLDSICRIKNSNLPFGGIQLILAGDFRQLPPVSNPIFSDNGEFCFLSPLFEVITHRLELRQVVRQSELQLIDAIAQCSMGNPTSDCVEFIQSLARQLQSPDAATKLFSTNEQVNEYNRTKIMKFPGQLYEFLSADTGERNFLSQMIIPKHLWLKIGAPVILMRNLSDKLVNGLKGEVSAITEEGPIVKFGEKSVPVPRMKCSGMLN